MVAAETLFTDLPLWFQIIVVVTLGVAILIVVFVVCVLVPLLNETLSPDAAEGDRDARATDGGGETDRVRASRASLDAATRLGDTRAGPGPARLHGLSDRVAGVGPVSHERRSAAKGFQRRY